MSGNTANYNDAHGIYISGNNSIISGNIANNNHFSGISLIEGNNNNVSGNYANDNGRYGIYMRESNFNNISGNTLLENKEKCIYERDCQVNNYSNNDSCPYGQDDGIIPGYNLYLLLGILSVLAVLISKKINNSFAFRDAWIRRTTWYSKLW